MKMTGSRNDTFRACSLYMDYKGIKTVMMGTFPLITQFQSKMALHDSPKNKSLLRA